MNPVITQRVIVMDMVLLLPMGAPPATERAPRRTLYPKTGAGFKSSPSLGRLPDGGGPPVG